MPRVNSLDVYEIFDFGAPVVTADRQRLLSRCGRHHVILRRPRLGRAGEHLGLPTPPQPVR
eukprot:774412-Pyramimonas_sp.AAC.1